MVKRDAEKKADNNAGAFVVYLEKITVWIHSRHAARLN
jgi:hypothetical protein